MNFIQQICSSGSYFPNKIIANANKTIAAYESSTPKTSESSAATPKQNKSAP
jgi:hypothetical protein